MWHVILDEQVLPKRYPTADEARVAARDLAAKFEAEHGRPATWVIAPLPAEH